MNTLVMPFLTLQFRRGTASQWSTANPTLAAGEMGIETDTNQFKLGDGTQTWNQLPYGGIQGPAATLSSVVYTANIYTSTLTADSLIFKSSIQLYGDRSGFFASSLNYVSASATIAVSFNRATGELGYSDYLQLSSITSLSTIQTSSLLFATTFNGLASTSKLSVSANTLLFNDAPIVVSALTTLPSTLSTANSFTSSIQASTLSLYNQSDSNFPILTLSSGYLLQDGLYMSSIASGGGITTIPSTLSTTEFYTSSIQGSTLSLYSQSDSNFPILTLSSGYLLQDGLYMSSIASGGITTIPSTLSTTEFYTSSIQTSTLYLYSQSDSNFPILTLSSGYLLQNGLYMSSIASGGLAAIPSTLSTTEFYTSSIQTSTLYLYSQSDSNFPILTLSSGYLLQDGLYMSSIASGGLATIPSTLSTTEFYTSSIQGSTLSLYSQSDSNFPILTLSSGYLLQDSQYMSSITVIPDYLSTIETYTSTLYASTTNTQEIILSTTTSTGRLYADDGEIYWNQSPLTQNYSSSFSTAVLYVSSIVASTLTAPMTVQVQFYTF